jgi:uncharacterized protein (TIGR03067 family)
MRFRCAPLLFTWLVCATVGLGQEVSPSDDDDFTALQGTWSIVALESDGRPSPEENYVGNTIEFSEDQIHLHERGLESVTFKFTLNAATDPKQIDLIVREQTAQGIYRLSGDDLSLCLSIGGERPQKFGTASGDNTELFTLKRGHPSDMLEWKTFKSVDEGFSVEMPGEPERRERTAHSLEGLVTAIFYVVRSSADRSSYMAVTVQLPEGHEGEKLDASVEEFGQEMLNAISAEAVVDLRSWSSTSRWTLLKLPSAAALAFARSPPRGDCSRSWWSAPTRRSIPKTFNDFGIRSAPRPNDRGQVIFR